MIDNRKKYQDKIWEQNCYFGYMHDRNKHTYKDKGCSCYVDIPNCGWIEVYSFGSEEECRQAVQQHNNELELKALLLNQRDEFGRVGFISIDSYYRGTKVYGTRPTQILCDGIL